MEKEIRVRKKRFAAFWTVVLLICMFIVPMVVQATEGQPTDGFAEGQVLSAGQSVSVEYVVYHNQDDSNSTEEYAVSGAAISIKSYAQLFNDTPAGKVFQHWQVKEINGSSGVVNGLVLSPVFQDGTIEAGTYNLTAGVAYKLGNVTTVSGDTSIYTPGSTFYVPATGTYTFQ